MMELESRPHRSLSINSSASNNATSELFICFTSRLSSSSSMKLSSAKSILSPGRPRDAPQISLSSSLSRRLRTNGSLKGGQASPMFPTGGKKRGCTFENPEPSSPKVTCIGQVRVKTKNQGKKLGANRRRHLSGGEASFRKVEVGTAGLQRLDRQDSNLMSSQLQASDYYGEECVAGRNQRQGHFPETLRTFGAEWNCFGPCGSSCSTKENKKGRGGVENKEGSRGGGSCSAVIARWLVALQEGPEGKSGGRKIELVVGDDERVDDRSGRHRRRAFEGIEFDERGVRGFEGKEDEEDRGRVSICVPPKNALLLMRCRSDPVKMAALVSKLCDTPVQSDEVDEEDAEEVFGKICGIRDLDAIRRCREEGEAREQLATVVRDEIVGNTGEAIEGEGQCTTVEELDEEEEVVVNLLAKELHELISSKIEEEIAMYEEATWEAGVSSCFMPSGGKRLERAERDGADNGAEEQDGEDEVLYECEELNCVLSVHFLSESEDNDEAELKEAEVDDLCLSDEKGTSELEEIEKSETEDRREDETRFIPDHRSLEKLEFEVKGEAPVLPDCLLLMMCEPKLSMEVSRETWVCCNDFPRWLPERPVANGISYKVDGKDDFKKKTRQHNRYATSTTTMTTAAPGLTSHQERILQQPARNSCSFPIKTSDQGAAESMAPLIEQKVMVSAKACGPLVLTRCKSEPMRAAIRLAPETCLWNNRKINSHGQPPVVSNIVKAAKLMV